MYKKTFLAAAALTIVFVAVCYADEIGDSRRNAVVRAIEKAAPGVVTINVVEIQATRYVDPFFSDFWGFFGPRRGRVQGRAVESVGSGFLFDARGHIITNYHVIENADAITSVTLPDGRNLDVELVGVDPRTDIAVLRAKGQGFPYLALGDSDDLLIGEWVIAIGNPFGNMMRDTQPSVSVCVLSATNRRVSRSIGEGERLYQNLIQTDAAINPGNSGGPLVNAKGEVIGVNTMIFSNTGGNQGLGFAIPVNRAKRVASEIITYGKRRSPWVGFHGEAVQNLAPYTRREFDIRAESGVIVTEILRSAPVHEAGLRLGDVVVEFAGEPVSHPSDIDYLNWDLFVGDECTLIYDRHGERNEITFEIEELTRR